MGVHRLCDWLGAGGETGQSLRLSGDSGAAQRRDCLNAAGDVAAAIGETAGRKPSSGEHRLGCVEHAGQAKLAFSRLRLFVTGRTCGVLRFQRYLLAGAGYSASAVGYLWSLGVVAEVIIFALSKKLFRRFGARDLLLLSAVCGVLRWGIMGWTTDLSWLIVAQILHCGTFTVCHLAAMRYIAARQGSEVIRLQAVYSAVAMGGSIAVMTVFAGFLYQHLGHGVFWVMALVALPAMFLRPKVVPSC